jgi:four helix bundle suffix protein
MNSNNTPKHNFIPDHGGFRKLLSYQKAEIIYDGTVYFTNRFFRKYDRTVDQMVQAARSGKQNIAEGSFAAATSKEIELKLTNIARASLIELQIDYEDFLRSKKLARWDKEHRLVARLRTLNKSSPSVNYLTFKNAIEHDDPEICANTMITLIHFCRFLLTRQIIQLETDFIEKGGVRERMINARNTRKRPDSNR